jgi:hypothetical protein
MELKWVCNPSSHIRTICLGHIAFVVYPFRGLDYLNAKEVIQLSQILHPKLLLQKLLQIKDVYIIISYDNQVINVNDYDLLFSHIVKSLHWMFEIHLRQDTDLSCLTKL